MSENQKTCEWISTDPVTKIDLRSVVTIEQAMKSGIQIVLFEGNYDQYESQQQKMRTNGESQMEIVRKLVQSGALQHLNRDRDLNCFNFENGQLQNSEFLRNPELVFASKSPAPTSVTRLAATELAMGSTRR